MGVWNWGLYGNDVTAVRRNFFPEIVRLPLDGAGLDRESATLFAGPSSLEDGWGMFVVLGAGYRYGCFAYYLILLLPRQGATMPDVSALAAGREIPCVADLVEMPRAHYPKMRLRSMGTLPILQEAIDSRFLPGTPPFDFLPQHLANVLNDPVPSNFQNRNLSLGPPAS